MTMTAKKDSKDGKTKTPTLIHLPQEVKRELEESAKASHVSQSVYVMQVLQAHFKRERAVRERIERLAAK